MFPIENPSALFSVVSREDFDTEIKKLASKPLAFLSTFLFL